MKISGKEVVTRYKPSGLILKHTPVRSINFLARVIPVGHYFIRGKGKVFPVLN
jgi:hypothetical protein